MTPEDDFELKDFFAQLEDEKAQLTHVLVRNYCEKFHPRPNLMIVRRGWFENLPVASKLFGMTIIEVENLAECKNGHVSSEMVTVFGYVKDENIKD